MDNTDGIFIKKILDEAAIFCDANSIIKSFLMETIITPNIFDAESLKIIMTVQRMRKILYSLIFYKMLDPEIYELAKKLMKKFFKNVNIYSYNLTNFANIITVSICIANKFIQDEPYNNWSFSSLLKMDVYTFNQLEIYFLSAIKFNIHEISL